MILGICGAGGAGRELMDLAEVINHNDTRWTEIIYIEKENYTNIVNEYRVLTFQEAVNLYDCTQIEFSVSVGEPLLRKKIATEILEADYTLATLVDPTVHIPKTTIVRQGAIIRGQAFISTDIEIGTNAMIQPRAVLGHDVKIGSHSVVSSLCALSGACTVGECSFLGVNTILKELKSIGDHTIVSMGSVVRKNIPDNVIAEGNPAKVICENRLQHVFGFNERN